MSELHPQNPTDWNPRVLERAVLELLCVGGNTCSLHFDNGILITVSGAFQLADIDGAGAGQWLMIPRDSQQLARLVEKEVCAARLVVSEVVALQVEFSDGQRLQIGGDGPEGLIGYDSWTWEEGETRRFFDG